MLTIRDHQTGDLFDPWAYLGEKRRRLLDRSWAGVFRKHLLEHLPVGELKRHFQVATGRPTKDLHVAVGVLILQQLHDLTDAGAVEAVAFNLARHYALDIRSESDAYFCERTLRNDRALVIEHGLDEIIFKNLADQLIRALGVDASKQRLDSTAIRSAMRNLTRLGVVVEGHAPVAVSAGAKRLQARFDQRICSDCPLKQRCVAQQGQKSRLQYTHERVAQRTRRLIRIPLFTRERAARERSRPGGANDNSHG